MPLEKIRDDDDLKDGADKINAAIDETNKLNDDLSSVKIDVSINSTEVKNVAERFVDGKNLFNKNDIIPGFFPNPSAGTLQASADHDCSPFISVEGNTNYVLNARGHIAYYNQDKQFVSGIHMNSYSVGSALRVPSNAKLIRFSVYKVQYSLDVVQFEKGTQPTSYEPFGKILLQDSLPIIETNKYGDKTVTPQKLSFIKFKTGKNLFDKSKAIPNKFPHPTQGGVLVDSTSHDSSDYREIESEQIYVVNVVGHIAFYDIDKRFISGRNGDSLSASVPITTPENAAYIRFSIRKSSGYSINMTQLEKGDTSTSYEPFYERQVLDGVYTENESEIIISDPQIINAILRRKWKEKKANFLGDSITRWMGTVHNQLKEELGFSEIRNYGVSGTTLVSKADGSGMIDRYGDMDNDTDLIFVLGGTNDFGQDTPLGDFDSTNTHEYVGAIRKLIEGLNVKYPGKTIVFGTIPPRFHPNQSANGGRNNNNDHPRDFAKALREVCEDYAIPVVDFYKEVGINVFNKNLLMSDNVHPDPPGYQNMKRLISSKLNEI